MMTLEQLRVFVAVAELEHLTNAASAIGLTPSAVSSAIKLLENYYDARLFDRVGRRIELTQTGRVFLVEAKATLARARSAELVLSELGGMKRGELGVHASQTIASNWLPPILMRFHETYPGISIRLTVGNTHSVAQAVLEGSAEIGFVEGKIAEPALNIHAVAQDALVVVVAPDHPFADGRDLTVADLIARTAWVMREPGSGTRSEFEDAVAAHGACFDDLAVAIVLPSNEAVLSAVASGQCAAAISRIAAARYLEQGTLKTASFELPVRSFFTVRHKERYQSKASRILEELCK